MHVNTKGLRKTLARLRRRLRKPAITGFVESLDFRVIRGWAIHDRGKPIQLSLRVDDQAYSLPAA